MKLIDLLSYIPDDCEIGLIPWDNGFSVSYGDNYSTGKAVGLIRVKAEADAEEEKMIREQFNILM